jgi:hypothetical protein
MRKINSIRYQYNVNPLCRKLIDATYSAAGVAAVWASFMWSTWLPGILWLAGGMPLMYALRPIPVEKIAVSQRNDKQPLQ